MNHKPAYFLVAFHLGVAVLRAAVLGQGYVRDIAIAPDGERIAVARTNQVEIWDSTLRRLIGTIPHTGRLAWSPDASKLAMEGYWITVWDVRARSKLGEWVSGAGAETLSWSPSGDRIVATHSRCRDPPPANPWRFHRQCS